MSSWGAMIENSDGKVIIEGGETGYVFLKKISSTVSGDSSFRVDTGVPLSWEPMIFISTDYYQMNEDYGSCNSARTITTYKPPTSSNAQVALSSFNTGRPVTYDFWIFVPAEYFTAGGWGMKIFNEKGKCIFHNNRINMVIDDKVDMWSGRLKSYPYTPAAGGNVYQIGWTGNSWGFTTVMGCKGNAHGWPANCFGGVFYREGSGKGVKQSLKRYAAVLNTDRYRGVANARLEDIHPKHQKEYQEAELRALAFNKSPLRFEKPNDITVDPNSPDKGFDGDL